MINDTKTYNPEDNSEKIEKLEKRVSYLEAKVKLFEEILEELTSHRNTKE